MELKDKIGLSLAVPGALLALISLPLIIAALCAPDLKAAAIGGGWKIPSEVEEGLKGREPNVKLLKAMYTLEIQNNDDVSSRCILLETDDAEYIHYENYDGKKTTVTKDIKGRKACEVVELGSLRKKGRISAYIWVTCPVKSDGPFKIIQEEHGEVSYDLKTLSL
jgi:hypothetical protein